MKTPNHWTVEDIETLERMAKEGLSSGVIAKALGRTRNSVIGKCNRADIRLSYEAPPGKPKRRKGYTQKKRVRQRFRKRVSVPIASLEEPSPTMAQILELKPRMCRFPYGDPKKGDFGFCGAERVNHHSYCHFHMRKAYKDG
jgi:GcrA cell cycle regulator